jgi:hypothetical protein
MDAERSLTTRGGLVRCRSDEVEAAADHPEPSVGSPKVGDVDGVTSTIDVVLPVATSERVDRSLFARRQPR